MNAAGKVALMIVGVLGIGLGVLVVTAKPAKATPQVKPPLPVEETEEPTKPGDGVVVVPPDADDDDEPSVTPVVVPKPEPEGGFDRGGPFAVPGIQDADEANRILLRWWSAEGAAFPASEVPPGTPRDFGSREGDLANTFGARQQAMARAFQHVLGMTREDGVLTNELLLALRKWAKSQELDEGAPIVVVPPDADDDTPETTPVVLPPIRDPRDPANLPPPPGPGGIQQPLPPLPPAPPVPVVPVPVPVVPVVVPPPAPAPAPPLPGPDTGPSPVEQPVRVPDDTARVAGLMLAAESTAKWKRMEPELAAWQKKRGLVADGNFGPKSALAMAHEIGTVPIVRFWPKGSFPEGKWVPEFRAELLKLADISPEPMAAQLRLSAEREQGQGFGNKQKPIPNRFVLDRVA